MKSTNSLLVTVRWHLEYSVVEHLLRLSQWMSDDQLFTRLDGSFEAEEGCV